MTRPRRPSRSRSTGQSWASPPLAFPGDAAAAVAERAYSHVGEFVADVRRWGVGGVAALAVYLAPIAVWLVAFAFIHDLIPVSRKPSINVTLLPAIDEVCGWSYRWFAAPTAVALDVLAAVPYTIHAVVPLFYAPFLLGRSRSPARLGTFAFTLGCMNIAAVTTHVLFPTAPPWYYDKYGLTPATYAMKGDPAGLSRLDTRVGSTFFHAMYHDGGKVVFGSWPSLHGAWPYLMAIFAPTAGSRGGQTIAWLYVALVWWAALYLQHHWFVDLLGGALYAEVAYHMVGRPRAEVAAAAAAAASTAAAGGSRWSAWWSGGGAGGGGGGGGGLPGGGDPRLATTDEDADDGAALLPLSTDSDGPGRV